MSQDEQHFFNLSIEAAKVFNPNTPVSEKDLFSGRKEQIRRVLDVVFQRGQHVIIFGERGVGKTSLANVLSSFVPNDQSNVFAVRVNCDINDSFETVWKKAFNEIVLINTTETMSFKPNAVNKPVSGNNYIPDKNVSPNDIRQGLAQLGSIMLPVIVIDEFDRLPANERRVFADSIKSLSDYALSATVILIGVGESVEHIINEHQSVSRALVQIQMPRMTNDEIKEILSGSLTKLGMRIDQKTLEQITLLAKGLPHYAHLIGLHATRAALDQQSMVVADEHLTTAITKGIQDAQHSIKANYHRAITSSRRDNLFSSVLLSCALASVDELGEFAAQDIRVPMQKITGRYYDIPAFAKHLSDFSDGTRGNILIKSGASRRYRYKFSDPLMQPYIIMQGIINGKIDSMTLMN